jgi:hypothetical protein
VTFSPISSRILLKLPFTDKPIITSFITRSIEKASLSKLGIISVQYRLAFLR